MTLNKLHLNISQVCDDWWQHVGGGHLQRWNELILTDIRLFNIIYIIYIYIYYSQLFFIIIIITGIYSKKLEQVDEMVYLRSKIISGGKASDR